MVYLVQRDCSPSLNNVRVLEVVVYIFLKAKNPDPCFEWNKVSTDEKAPALA